MRIRIHHTTRYFYPEKVRDSFNEARLQPLDTPVQRCRSFALKTDPVAALRDYRDFYRNRVHMFEVAAPHHALSVVAVSVVETFDDPRQEGVDPTTDYPIAAIRPYGGPENLHDFLQPSRLVEADPEIWRRAIDWSEADDDAYRVACRLNRQVFERFQYDPGATLVQTTAGGALNQGRGVCQDYAHALIALCRSLKIPARYVSGYFLPHGIEELCHAAHEEASAQASHAWAEVWLPHFGWWGLDPTHGRELDRHYVKVAVGRDYGDARPLSGSYRGPPAREMEVQVRVTREPEAPALTSTEG
ncbi:MAG: transglutaminase family protein [Opitutales bacterium]